MRVLGFLVVAFMLILGVIGLLVPHRLMEMARFTTTPNGIYVAAGIRMAIGAVLLMVATQSRFPKILRVLGTLALIGGIGTLILGSLRAREIADWVSANGTPLIRMFGVFALTIGGFIAYAIGDRRYV
jgi:protein-S-isoprenylcysteine O-methyltransferase Ste14